ncbi:hypothetical protein PM3016_1456 [Paenibacillus mucilaginosus 3016]|uniref:Uncharacterized protein n=1 Tax=Paenibacillus mucilaginosus 3016 TaxID=1116391 RepID=H6NGT9_9BACL|nr:hypothetical protein [Paenibacillus mucilaginosus]AFC28381.1 hypothetical protein PM3016_1456 [Paenibacillus mucilaginosus 3016]WFA17181.1 hypothetical protein ERY13_07655 [Paenibacillus mucilaginosus]
MSILFKMEELFPKASKADIIRTKAYLSQYKEKKRRVEMFERNPPQTDELKEIQTNLIKFTSLLERAVAQIIHDDVRKVIEYRFLKGNSRAATILRFESWECCDKTIDRKIIEGIESVANTLLYLE